jgi:hypothetical protein
MGFFKTRTRRAANAGRLFSGSWFGPLIATAPVAPIDLRDFAEGDVASQSL